MPTGPSGGSAAALGEDVDGCGAAGVELPPQPTSTDSRTTVPR